MVWIGAGIWLHASSPHGPGLVSLAAAVFILGGMFAAAVVFGILSHVLTLGMARWFATMRPPPEMSTVAALGWIKLAGETALVAGAAWVLFEALYVSHGVR
jgi:hypothetical protein